MKSFDKQRPLSWSAISSFEYDPEQWYKKYVLGEEQKLSAEMIFGKKIGKRLETDPTFLPQIPRHSKMEHAFNVMFGEIPLVGYADSFCDVTNKRLLEFKTGKKEWDQKRVDEHGQLTMYCLMNYITNKINPEDMDIQLIWMPTRETGSFDIEFIEPIEKNIKVFNTKRSMVQMLSFAAKIKRIYKEMEDYAQQKLLTTNVR